MIIRKKPARQHGLHEPFRHENQPRPPQQQYKLQAFPARISEQFPVSNLKATCLPDESKSMLRAR